jgi:predicted nuclease of predicted toxin-antitoxin system
MSKPRLHLDADISIKALQAALAARGHDVSRTPNTWVADDASDETQLLAATSQGRCIITYNVGDFVRLARRIPNHAGIVLVTRPDWTLSGLITALDRLLAICSAEELAGQVRWLSEWR